MAKYKTFGDLATDEKLSESYRDIYKMIDDVYPKAPGVMDSERGHSLSDLAEIQSKQYEIVKANLVKDGASYRTATELREQSRLDMTKLRQQILGQATDGYSNSMTGVGTGTDPNYYTSATIPVSLSPYEVSAIYSNGGLPQVIVNKKSKGIILNDFYFEGLEVDDCAKLKDYALKVGFDRALPLRDAVSFGGAGMYPRFKRDNLGSFVMSLEDLMKIGVLDINCIDYWITPDRWNIVHVPNYNLTAKDYLNPDFIYVPLGAQKVNCQRVSLLKPYPLPYWAAIQQLGWSTSDFVGYLKQIYDYEIMISSLPIMFQQMSLIFQTIPFDASMLTNGPDEVKALQVLNQQQMRSWSGLNPKLVNSVGDIKVIERTYAGFADMINSIERNIGARSSIPYSVLFSQDKTGFSKDTEDLTLKQSEAIRFICNEITPQLKNVVKILAISCFGRNSMQAQADISLVFGNPAIITDQEKADIGTKFGGFVQAMTSGAGMPLDMTLTLAKEFYTYEMDEAEFARLQQIPEEPEGVPNPLDIMSEVNKID